MKKLTQIILHPLKFSYRLLCDCNWLDFSRKEGSVSASLMNRSCIDVTCRRENLIGKQTAEIVVQLNFDNGEQKEAKLYILADSREMIPNVFYERNGCICINAEHFIKKSDIMGRGFTRISDLGRSSSAMKCYPATYDWSNQQCKPWMQYDVWLQHAGEPGIIMERILIYPKEKQIPYSYLGPEETR